MVLEAAQPEHELLVFSLRNHPTVRQHLRNPAPIAFQSHQQWYGQNIPGNNTLQLFIVHHQEHPVGIALLRDITDTICSLLLMVGTCFL